jgi:hypothetical protein
VDEHRCAPPQLAPGGVCSPPAGAQSCAPRLAFARVPRRLAPSLRRPPPRRARRPARAAPPRCAWRRTTCCPARWQRRATSRPAAPRTLLPPPACRACWPSWRRRWTATQSSACRRCRSPGPVRGVTACRSPALTCGCALGVLAIPRRAAVCLVHGAGLHLHPALLRQSEQQLHGCAPRTDATPRHALRLPNSKPSRLCRPACASPLAPACLSQVLASRFGAASTRLTAWTSAGCLTPRRGRGLRRRRALVPGSPPS